METPITKAIQDNNKPIIQLLLDKHVALHSFEKTYLNRFKHGLDFISRYMMAAKYFIQTLPEFVFRESKHPEIQETNRELHAQGPWWHNERPLLGLLFDKHI